MRKPAACGSLSTDTSGAANLIKNTCMKKNMTLRLAVTWLAGFVSVELTVQDGSFIYIGDGWQLARTYSCDLHYT